MACTPSDYMRLLSLVESPAVMCFYFSDGTYVRGMLTRAELDPASRSGTLLLHDPSSNNVITAEAGNLLKISTRAPDGSMR